ncbi:MAG: hypothetical protein ACOH2A_00540 [Sphingobacteriaceae bacterium]
MMKWISKCLRTLVILVTIINIQACATIGQYDQSAYAQTISLKVDALSLIDKATDSYDGHVEAIDMFNLKLDKAYEFEKHRPKNEIGLQMWAILKSPDKHLLGGLIARWKIDGKLGRVFIAEIKPQIAEAFDLIAELESKKIQGNDAGVQSFLSKNR